MTYLALYRQWRPRSFSEVAGQEHVTRTLQNALRAGRVSHAYLFTGPRGTGKTTVARILARAVNCATGPGPEPCNQCEACRAMLTASSPDVVEIDAASHRGIDEMRDLRERVRFAPATCRYRVYVVDEVHMLTAEAFNALLKTLEEPPAHAIFVMATTEPHRIPLTVMSRCQRFDFRRLPEAVMREVLVRVARAEQAEVADEALEAIARRAEGSLRDALGVLDQCLAYGGKRISLGQVHDVLGTVPGDVLDRMAKGLHRGEVVDLLQAVDEMVAAGKDMRQLARDLTDHLRQQLVAVLEGRAGDWSAEALLRALQELAQAEADMRWSPQPRLLLEMALLRLTARAGRAESRGSSPAAPGEKTAPAKTDDPPPETTVDLERRWPQVVEAVRRRSVPASTFLEAAHPVRVAQGTLVLGFSPGCEVHMKRVEGQGMGLLLEALREVTGQDWEVRLKMLGKRPSAPAAAKDSEAAGGPVQQALELFGGEVVDG